MAIGLVQFYRFEPRIDSTNVESIACARATPRQAPLSVAVCVLVIAIAGCATQPASVVPPARSAPTPRNAEPPPPNVNLSGFPLPYRQGYADGCASAGGTERKDASRFASDGNYRTGWTDGVALCKKK